MRLPLVGTKDVGDIRCHDLPEFVFECKNRKDALSSLSEIMKETEQERINADAKFAAALVKRRNFGTGGAYGRIVVFNETHLQYSHHENPTDKVTDQFFIEQHNGHHGPF